MEKVYSFIIPHHNCPKLLNRLIDSIPSRADVEVIVVDDNSAPDKKPENLREGVILINVPANESKGAGHARNVGLENATGKWLLFADSDDYYENGFLEVLDKYKDSQLDILYFNIYSEVSQGDQSSILQRYAESSKERVDKCILGFSSNAPWNKMFRHDFVKCVGEKFEEIPSSNDAWFANSMSVNAINVDVEFAVLYHYVNNPVGITGRLRPIKDRFVVMKSICKRNKLKYECGCIDLIDCSFDFNRFRCDYGLFQTLRYRILQICRDKYLRKAMCYKAIRKDA